jgi:DNA-binding CsgD family transcriptional regulator
MEASQLTKREHEIIVLMAADGITGTAQISARLFISANTVRAHMASIFAKLDVNSRARVVQYAFATDMVTR